MEDSDFQNLHNNIAKIHTTEMGIERIKRNLCLDSQNVIEWCKVKIADEKSSVIRKGKKLVYKY